MEEVQLMLPFKKKYEIIQMLERGESKNVVAEKYGIPWVTAHSLYVRRKEIKKYFDFNKKVTKGTLLLHISDLETILYKWFIRCKEKNIKLSGSDIQKKALEFNENLGIDSNFKASQYWLRKFKGRHGIPFKNETKSSLASITNTMSSFKSYLKQFLQDNEITLQNVYNANYSAIMWKAVPEETSIFNRVQWTGDQDMCEDHITVLLCTNATGCHKLPVLIVGNISEPQSSSILNTNGISTIYKVNSSAWIDNIIFNQWFEEYFLQLVKERQEKDGCRQKTLLLLNNITSLYDIDDLNGKDEFVIVMSFPRDVSPEVQPINDEIIDYFKRMYRKELVVTLMLLPVWNTEEEVIQTYKRLTLWDSCRMIHDAWSYVGRKILKRGWDLFFGRKVNNNEITDILTKDIKETVAYLRTLPGCERCYEKCVLNWFKIENVRNMTMKICTDEVLRSFGNIDIVNNENGPSRSKIPKGISRWIDECIK